MAEQTKKRGRPPGSKNNPKLADIEKQIEDDKRKNRLKDEIWAIVFMAIGIFLVISLQTEAAGQFGRIISDTLKGLFGSIAYILPYYLILYGILLFLKRTTHIDGKSAVLLLLIFLMATIINSARYLESASIPWTLAFIKETFNNGILLSGGGTFGMTFGLLLIKAIGKPGLYIFCSVIILISILLVVNTPVSQFIEDWKKKRSLEKEEKQSKNEKEDKDNKSEINKEIITSSPRVTPGQMKIIDYMKDDQLFEGGHRETSNQSLDVQAPAQIENKVENKSENKIDNKAESKPEELKINISSTSILYKLPPIDLLSKAPSENRPGDSAGLKAKAMKLEQTLHSFNVNAKILQVTKGPAVTRYEIQPDVGVKVSSIVRLADDIALNLEAKSIRIEAPIPGKAAVGIEVENERVNLVAVRDIIESREFKNAKSMITFAVGKDISGCPIISDLKEMPHLLIAGSTGSGKSVCLNALIISILYRARPEDVKFVLIDPKVVELGNYNGIPHLLIPVVTEPSKAAAALNWAVSEMTDRYNKFANEGVRDLESFNTSVKEKGETQRILPQIVIIIDELADLMMAAPSQVEESICRLAQMARAAGMHLIVATQRPSVDVITGVIKANIPSRISFAVSSQFDSRTIIDMSGAEKLVGKGDMLFNPVGISKPIRVQGAFISDSEVHKVIDFLKKQVPENEYATDVINRIEKTFETKNDDDSDELLQDAIETVVRAEQASVSMLQRRFRIGYNRAARLVDMMEARGIIGPSEGSRPRKVLITEEQFLNLGKDPEEQGREA
ncbi:MAG: DNA translocase FtsK [Eubacteriales bacterium]|nr:DNA translocase FtsK [Eubacteriales bacterium]